MRGAGAIPSGAAVVVLSGGALALGRAIVGALPAAKLHGLRRRVDAPDVAFDDARSHLCALFRAGTPIVGVCAAGILVRALAPVLDDKGTDPPVVAVADDGSVAVPLLGAHAGANRIARAIAAARGSVAAVTSATDSRFGFALDEPPRGWRIANPDALKGVAADLLAGEPVGLRIEAGDGAWLRGADAPFAEHGARAVLITDRATTGDGRTLVMHPPVLALGLGCERGAAPEEALALATETLAARGLAGGAIACVASIDLKEDEDAVHATAAEFGVPARFFSAARLEALTPRLAKPSRAVFRAVGCHGVAEGAALAVCGPPGRLVVEKTRSKRVTFALARAENDIDVDAVGRPRGRLAVVGLGPGDAACRTPEATRALADADDVVGYGRYLDLAADAIAGKVLHASPIGAETARVRKALGLAAQGRAVALVSSGDPGIYALATLVFEEIDRAALPEWRRLAVSVVPGVSALQAAAARAGAPLGHDFCAISLSDLLTPWAEIERRLRAAAEGDFVVVLFNPASKVRKRPLLAARDILLERRPPETPVVLARNLGRVGEDVRIVALDSLTPDAVDMTTTVIVGSARTRSLALGGATRIYTPRGYASKAVP